VKTSTFQIVVTLAIAVTALHVARDLFLPLALAVLLTFLLTPIVLRLERRRVPRVPAVLLTVLVVACAGGLIAYRAAEQVLQVAAELPHYRQNIQRKLQVASSFVRPWKEQMRAAGDVVADLTDEGAASDETPGAQAAPNGSELPPDDDPGTGAIEGEWSALQLAWDWFVPVLSPFATGAIVVVFTIFMLIEREDLRNRFIVICGVEHVPGTTEALLDAAERVSRYLRMQLLINCMYGVALAVTCWMTGLPNPLLWAGIGAVFRFVPYAGAVLGAGLPLLIAVAMADGWTVVVVLAVVLAVLELIVNNVLEPWLYGNSTGVSPSGILIAAFFWTWLWGGVGLLLATPLTVLLTVVGRQIPPLRFLTTLLSDEPPLAPAARLYQRLLAGDAHESLQIVEKEMAAQNSEAHVADLLLQPLLQTVMDQAHGLLDHERHDSLLGSVRELETEFAATLVDQEWSSANRPRASLVVAPARLQADGLAAEIVASMLQRQGWQAKSLPRTALVSDLASQILDTSSVMLVLCAIGPRSIEHCRYVLRHLSTAKWSRPVILYVLSDTPPTVDEKARLTSFSAGVSVVTSAIELIDRLEKSEGEPTTSEDALRVPSSISAGAG
jgi:predicted PurR-regulated permease PerM